jgi:PAS domain S-box-containing protein
MKPESKKVLDYLESVFKDFERTEVNLKAANQQLQASNQQIRASEEEIRLKIIEVEEAHQFANGVLNTINEPFLVLDKKLNVVMAGRAFYEKFQVSKEDTEGCLVYELGNKQWDIPKLRVLLSAIFRQNKEVVNYEVRHRFETIGQKIMLLSAREIIRDSGRQNLIFLAIEDITEQKVAEEKMAAVFQQLKATEQQLRAANQQLIASEQQLKAGNQQLRALNQQQKSTELSLREERDFSKNLLETANSFIVVLDIDANIRLFNSYAEKMSGFSKQEVIGKNWFETFIPKSDRKTILQVFSKVLDEMPDYSSYQNKIQCRDHSQKLIKWGNTILKNAEGKRIGVLSIGVDMTDIEMFTSELSKLSVAVTQSPVIIAITDAEGKVEYVNPRYSEITAYSYEETLGKNLRILKSGELPDEIYQNLWATITSGKIWHGEFHNKKKNGELFWEVATISPIVNDDNKIINYIKIAEDITERKREEEIRKKVNTITNTAITTRNLDDFIGVVKKELSSIIDTTNFYIALYQEENDIFQLVYHEDQKDDIRAFPAGKTLTAYVFRTKKPLLATKEVEKKLVDLGELELVGAQSKVWLGVPLLVKDKAIGVMAVQSYKTTQAFTDKDLEMMEIVSHQISILMERKKADDDIKIALDKALESERLKSAFLTNMSHEIRTPMNGILGFLQLLTDAEISDEERKEYSAVVNRSSKRMISTINDLIEISKIESGLVQIKKTKVSLNKLLEEVVSVYEEDAIQKALPINVHFEKTDDQSEISVDEPKLHGILTNLIKNAIKYTTKGYISIGYHLMGEKVEFFVEDTGIGIPKNRQEAIFNRFEQADIEDTRAFEGSGLGLAISKAYVEMLDGSIWVVSEENKGSKFIFSIPV